MWKNSSEVWRAPPYFSERKQFWLPDPETPLNPASLASEGDFFYLIIIMKFASTGSQTQDLSSTTEAI